MKNMYEINYMLDPNIDERIKNICRQAENNYILSFAKKNQPLKNNNNIILDQQKNNNDNIDKDEFPLDKTITKSTNSEKNINILEKPKYNTFINYDKILESQQILMNQTNNNNNILSFKDNKISSLNNNKIIFNNSNINQKELKNNISNSNNCIKENNIITKRNKTWNKNNKSQKSNINDNTQNLNISFKNRTINLNKDVINSINNKIMFKSNNILSPNTFNVDNNNNEDDIKNYNSKLLNSQPNQKNKSNTNSFFSSNPSFCLECDLQNLINDKNIYNKDLNNKYKENKQINNIILSGKILLQKNKFQEAYNILSLAIKNGINHPDLFYLYGEVCRKLKYMEDAEKYLLACLNYKNCSQYVYLGLAQLYKEIGKIKYSKNFYKKYLLYFKDDSIYYNLGINYMKLNKPLKALNYLSEAIELKQNQPIYYKTRSEIYKTLGHKDLYKKDLNQYNLFLNKNN